MFLHDIDTPALFVDLDQLITNIRTMQKKLNQHDIRCRPHIKTHKIPAIAHMQIKEGAKGITCQKLGEAEVMINSGIKDILLAYNIVGEKKLNRLTRLVKQADIKVVADSAEVLNGLSEIAQKEEVKIKVLVECDIAVTRSGVRSPNNAIKLAEKIQSTTGLEYEGLMQFKGGYPDIDFVKKTGWFFKEVVDTLQKKGIKTEIVSSGGTVYAQTCWPTYSQYISIVNECRPGAYVFFDRIKVDEGVARLDQCAAKIISTVISKPDKNRVIIDAGSKSIGIRRGYSDHDLGSHGHIVEYPDAVLSKLYEEHGIIDNYPGEIKIGEKITIIPNYIMDNIHFHDTLYGVRRNKVEAIWPIAARGKMQ